MKKLMLVLALAAIAGPLTAYAQQAAGGAIADRQNRELNRDPGAERAPSATAINGNISGNEVRGDPQSGSTSDRETSRTWSGIGSTGGGTGTGTSSGTAPEPPSSAVGTEGRTPSVK